MKLNDFIRPVPKPIRKTVVVPFANDPDVIGCIARAMAGEIADFILIGEADKIRAVAVAQKVDIERAEFVHAADEHSACDMAARFVHEGRAQALMKGLVQSSSYISAILHKQHGLVMPGQMLSCVATFEIPSYPKPLFVTDPGVNIAPSLEAKARILKNAVELARKLGVVAPKVACIEAVEKVTPKMAGTAEARALREMGEQGIFGDAVVDGPLGFDAAISPKAAHTKGVPGIVAGHADIVLLPEIRAANVLYKSLVWFAGAAVASIVVGARAPIVLPSRSDSEATKLFSVALAVNVAE